AARLPGNLFQLPVEIDGVLLQAGDVRVAVEGVHAAGRMPGRAAGELAALDQQHILPTRLGEVIQDARAHHSPADHHHPRIALHGPSSSYITRWTPPAALAELRSPRHCRYRTDT